jgi:nitrogen fixation protein FixH
MTTDETQTPEEARRTRRVIKLWIAAGTVFALSVLGYSGVMIYLAQRDYPGSVVNDYFENYKRFNQFTERLERQEGLGWDLATSVDSLPVVGDRLDVEVVARNASGQPMTGAEVVVHFVRNVNSRADRRVRLADLGDGRYFGKVSLPRPGNWTIRTTIRNNGRSYQAQRYLWVEEPLE